MVIARRRGWTTAGERDRPSPQPGQHAGSDAYRQQARRLRARFHGQPTLLHQSLRALSRDRDNAACIARPVTVVTPPLPAVFEVSPETVRRFSRMVRDHLEGQILRYEPRQLLIRAAGRMGIDRFQANLIIAAVQHAQPATAAVDSAPAAPMSRWIPGAVMFLLIQAAVAALVWQLIVA